MVYVGYLHREYAIVFVSMVNVPDDLILVLFCKSFITVSLDANSAISSFKNEPGLIAAPDSLLDPIS
jgi:hypothetical protein